MRHLSEVAAAWIGDLRREGCALTDEDVCRLNDIGRRMESPGGGCAPPEGVARRAGSTGPWLYPFTVQGGRWHERMRPLFGASETWDVLLLGYALAHGRTPGAFAELCDYDSARAAVESWAGRLPCRWSELCACVRTVLADEIVDGERAESGDSDPQPVEPVEHWTPIVLLACELLGGTVDQWERTVARRYMLDAVRAATQKWREKGTPPDPDDPKIRAVREMGLAVEEIRKRKVKHGE